MFDMKNFISYPKNVAKAKTLYRKAADLGVSEALAQLMILASE